MPVQSLSAPVVAPTRERMPKVRSEPIGVDAAKAAMCFRHSPRGRPVPNKDIVSAKAVGAGKGGLGLSVNQASGRSDKLTLVYHYSQEYDN